MPEYKVRINSSMTFTVIADSEEEAESEALEWPCAYEFLDQAEVTDVDLIEESEPQQ